VPLLNSKLRQELQIVTHPSHSSHRSPNTSTIDHAPDPALGRAHISLFGMSPDSFPALLIPTQQPQATRKKNPIHVLSRERATADGALKTTRTPETNAHQLGFRQLGGDEARWLCRVCRGAATSLLVHNLYSILPRIIARPLLVWNTLYVEIYEPKIRLCV